ncbi:SDR family NAD(P)-dependent oxidoreductase [Pseudoclavibacter helvolus]|uniref:NAD(P)-dependent dehydrogenase (Short-subunit alcohol dehydrogenase family) n=1 Tax=Pseudoclavibacter helvolus TaxID=255205 RepID=A0A7W4UMM9_9MICO|nr:SDR family NAD(P)-dependent oxidoreductase [Pseudoclavibacter helvolus]MBB2957255.1 NAD(P)-dependent dehydrogenase (short-subunit alcohol dehydrogenase family) [Pseudoclavibacter helvolus]
MNAAAEYGPHDLSGRRYLVTGASTGLGFFTASSLVSRGAQVVVTGRSAARLDAAASATGRPDLVTVLPFDIAELNEVREAAATLLGGEQGGRQGFDGVVLNAGVVHPPAEREETSDGVERLFATNVLGHFALLSHLTVGRDLREGAAVVWLGSIAPGLTRAHLQDVQLRGGYTSWSAYAQSKLATQVLAIEGDRRARAAGAHVRSLVAHPGYSTGGLTPTVPGVHEPSLGKRALDSLLVFAAQGKDAGARCQLRAVTDPELRGGETIRPAYTTKGRPVLGSSHWRSYNAELGERLWDYCESLAGTAPDFSAMSART